MISSPELSFRERANRLVEQNDITFGHPTLASKISRDINREREIKLTIVHVSHLKIPIFVVTITK